MELDPRVRRPALTVLFGGSPPRMLRLSRRGAELVSAMGSAAVGGAESARLARRLTDHGIGIPRPGPRNAPVDVTVVVPVRDRTLELGDCLGALGSRHRVLVVDDGSANPDAVVASCRLHGADLVRRVRPGGPAAARNTGLRAVTSELVAFCDSDCLPGPGWIEDLAGHFVDPLVVGVAPRIVAASSGRGLSLVDQGVHPAPVHLGSAVPFVPAAAVVFRRAPLGDGFDETLRYGEDVDLVWRLAEAGWRVRYEPGVTVAHRDPTGVVARLRRRFGYGTSAGPLERAHPGAIDHLSVGLGPACTLGGLIVGAPGTALLAWALTALRLRGQLRPLGLGTRSALEVALAQVIHAWVGLGRWCTIFGVPLAAGMVLGRRRRRARRVRTLLLLSSGSALLARRSGPGGAARRVLVDDCLGEMAYGVGVLASCARSGVLGPLVPRVRRTAAPRDRCDGTAGGARQGAGVLVTRAARAVSSFSARRA
ncbi:MAG: mycofactocin biosynthesis glycosyltransferase MftF [Acidimicrobiales bacterium]